MADRGYKTKRQYMHNTQHIKLQSWATQTPFLSGVISDVQCKLSLIFI